MKQKSEIDNIKGFKDLSKRTIPIVMKDRHYTDKLKEILSSLEGVASFELEDYIEQLELIGKEFTSNISNNLKLYGMKEDIQEITEKMIDKVIILGSSSSEYNCHGWSFGCVRNIPLSSNKGDLLKEVSFYRDLKDYKSYVNYNVMALFSIDKATLKDSINPNFNEGSVIAYYGKDKVIAHTAKYIKSLNWYTYEEKYYKEWYDKDKGIIKFDNFNNSGESNHCVLDSYTSKLGLGYLIAHNFEDLVPLYGDDLGFYDLVII